MTVDPGQSGRDRRELAGALKSLRLAVGLSGARLAIRCGMSQSKVSRIETGRVLPSVVDVQLIVRALGVDSETGGELIAQARVANTAYDCVRASVRRGLHHRQRELAALEASATELRFFLPTMPTGLLQTAEYMRAAMAPSVDPVQVDVSRTVALKLERQAILHDTSKRFDFLLTESALRWRLCPSPIMAMQLDRVVSLSRLPHVRVGVVPLSTRTPNGAFHTFTVYDHSLATAELFTGRIAFREQSDIAHHIAVFEHFREVADTGSEARLLLQKWADDFRGGP